MSKAWKLYKQEKKKTYLQQVEESQYFLASKYHVGEHMTSHKICLQNNLEGPHYDTYK